MAGININIFYGLSKSIGVMLVASIFVTCFSCKQEKSIEFDRTELLVKFRTDTSDNSPLFALNTYVTGDTAYISYVNHQTHSLHISDFKRPNKDPVIIKLVDTLLALDLYGRITSTSLSNNRLAFFQKKRFGIYNLKNNKIEYSRSTVGSDTLPIFFVDYDLPIHYVDSTKEIYLQCIDHRSKDKKYTFDHRFHFKLNWETGEWSIFPLVYPSSWGNGELGFSAFTKCSFKGDSVIYSFSNEDYLVILNRKNLMVERINARSRFHENIIPLEKGVERNFDNKLSQNVTSFKYLAILYDKWKNCYYRVYNKSQSLMNKEGFFNTGLDLSYGVLVLDSNLSVIGELEIPDKMPSTFGVSSYGLTYLIPNTLRQDLDSTKRHNNLLYVALDIKL